jgi:hypothetical protein
MIDRRSQERNRSPKTKIAARVPWTKEDIRMLKVHSKARTPAMEAAKP